MQSSNVHILVPWFLSSTQHGKPKEIKTISEPCTAGRPVLSILFINGDSKISRKILRAPLWESNLECSDYYLGCPKAEL